MKEVSRVDIPAVSGGGGKEDDSERSVSLPIDFLFEIDCVHFLYECIKLLHITCKKVTENISNDCDSFPVHVVLDML